MASANLLLTTSWLPVDAQSILSVPTPCSLAMILKCQPIFRAVGLRQGHV